MELKGFEPNSLFATYESGLKFDIHQVIISYKFLTEVPMIIPANTTSITIDSQSPTIPGSVYNAPNLLYQFYNTPARYQDFLIFGVNWNSPFVELQAKDPSGTPFWQAGPSLVTAVISGDRIYGVTALFGVRTQTSPTLIFNRRLQTVFAPFPLNVPLPFKAYFYGVVLKYKTIEQNVPPERLGNYPVIYLYSPFPEIYSTQGVSQ